MSIASTISECSNSIMRVLVLYRFQNIYSELNQSLMIYLPRNWKPPIKVGNMFALFCLVEICQTMPLVAILVPWFKPLTSRGAPRWFHNVFTYGARVIEFLIFFSVKIQ